VQKLIAGWRVADRGVAALIASWPGQHWLWAAGADRGVADDRELIADR
jgi:hypothetical protein